MKPKYLMTGYAIALLVYAGWRSFDYVSGSLAGIDKTVATLVAIIFLFASEVGLLIWLHKAMPSATTDTQEATATTMIGINFVGSMVLGLADVLKHNTLYNVRLDWLDPVLLLAPWVLIAANVGGVILYHLNDSEEMLHRAERRLAHAESKLEIEARTKAVQELEKNEQALAEKLAPHYYADLVARVEGRTLARFDRQLAKQGKAQEPTNPAQSAAPVEPGKNGRTEESIRFNADSVTPLGQAPGERQDPKNG